jgi:3D (Asp-Asp-Asp) domain-containing protein
VVAHHSAFKINSIPCGSATSSTSYQSGLLCSIDVEVAATTAQIDLFMPAKAQNNFW